MKRPKRVGVHKFRKLADAAELFELDGQKKTLTRTDTGDVFVFLTEGTRQHREEWVKLVGRKRVPVRNVVELDALGRLVFYLRDQDRRGE
jgi:hypothetical protein